ncbi:hypothetical protein PAE9249_00558 [Paenibacillus sp. CECT 9249]|uniref:TIGR01440 family protein n=1 Tax=Paenibacillus sp. CECT 9249 TaxID=2845385 RepID=UPI001E2EDB13|nr:TIGR01440 family protein [Paenibacillus sp. CECT 9249]CAH0118093.1 hypothetical protein PAE9249_00558 [Paenibacillus sp. CECT 9249]
MSEFDAYAGQAETVARELASAGNLRAGQLVVIGVSTSEVLGRHIGTSGTEEVAAALYTGLARAQADIGFHLAFQCCEHLNRALVVERAVLDAYGLDEVSAVPVAKAGGSMAAYAFRRMADPCLAETIQAHAGIDIGETLIGMHLRRVAVPLRPSVRQIGAARVTAAYTRPKLIGGERAVYGRPDADACV